MMHEYPSTLVRLILFTICLALAGSFVAGTYAMLLANSRQGTGMDPDSSAGITVMTLENPDMEQFILRTGFPESPAKVPYYMVDSLDHFQKGSENASVSVKRSIPGVNDAPALAEITLESYGGLPSDARLIDAIPLYRTAYNTATDVIEERKPVRTQVRYIQTIGGVPVFKTRISVMLGENGELLDLYRCWINEYHQSGEIAIVPAEAGFEKLRNGVLMDRLQGTIHNGTEISAIEWGYYLNNGNNPREPATLTPVWAFTVLIGPDREPFNLYVDATE